MLKSQFKILYVIGGLIFTLILAFVFCYENIDSGSIGLKVPFYGDQKGRPITVVPGSTWFTPWTEKIVEIPGYVQHKVFEPFQVLDADGTSWRVAPILNYRIIRERTIDTYIKYRKTLPELEDGIITTHVLRTYRVIVNTFKTDSVINSRARMEKMFSDTLAKKLADDGFILEDLTAGFTPPDKLVDVINDKNNAVQEAMKIENQVKTSQAQARKDIAEAEGKAGALRVQADAEAYANKVRNSTLTPLLVKMAFIEAWKANGSKVPNSVYMSGGNGDIGSFILPMGSDK